MNCHENAEIPQKKKKTRRKRKAKCVNSDVELNKAGFKNCSKSDIAVCDILHSGSPIETLHPSHILNTLPATEKGASQLLSYILDNVDVGIPPTYCRKPGLVTDFNKYIEIMTRFLKQNKRFSMYVKLCWKQEVIPDNKKTPDGRFPPGSVLSALSFLVRHIVPEELLGKRNRQIFMRSVSRIVNGSSSLNLSISSVVCGMKVSDVPWLQTGIPSNSFRLNLLASHVKWLLLWVKAVIQALWYVTDCTPRQGFVYFRKHTWQRLSQQKIQVLTSGNRPQLVEAETDTFAAIGKLRFMPKPGGLRPIVSFKIPADKYPPSLISDVRMLLWQIAHSSGSVHTPLGRTFSDVLTNSMKSVASSFGSQTMPQYYFVRVDISDAFGSISHNKMLSILQKLKKKFLPSSKDFVEAIRMFHRNKFNAKVPVTVFKCKTFELQYPERWFRTGATEQRPLLPMLKAMADLVHHLGLTFGKKLYRIKHGIPQGMPLSGVFCELYYSDLDSEHLKEFVSHSKEEIFIRYVDDYLFITPDKARAEKFLQVMQNGFPEYFSRINNEKTQTNLNDANIYEVPFVGVTVNISNFTVGGNFANYEGVNMSNMMSMAQTRNCGRMIESRMKLLLKLPPILLNMKVNNKHVVLLNIYQAALFMAFRLHALIRSKIPSKRLNQRFVFRCVKTGVNSISSFSMRTIQRICPNDRHRISLDEVNCIALRAYEARLSRSAAHYHDVLKLLKGRRLCISKRLTRIQLKTICKVATPVLPGVFKTIK